MGKLLTRRAGSRGLGSVTLVAVAMLAGAVAAACAPGSASDPGRIAAVGAESEYANVITQIGGPYVAVSAVMSNPNIDPHTYEASPQVAQTVSTAQLVVQNGAGYDGFMETIEVATPSSTRRVIDVQSLLGLPATTENPHLWYSPATMPAVAKAIGKDLAALAPSHEAYFTAEVTVFDTSLAPWTQAIAALKSSFSGAPVATTEPVADDMLQAAGLDNVTPWPFQADVMNGVDPSAQDVSLEQGLLTGHRVKVFVYNQQVTDSLTQSLLTLAQQNHIPVVGVYETMPTPGYDYQSWMVAEVKAVRQAFARGVSTTRL
jgi:zinc/manganese transport system substrate-binding protein